MGGAEAGYGWCPSSGQWLTHAFGFTLRRTRLGLLDWREDVAPGRGTAIRVERRRGAFGSHYDAEVGRQ